MPEWISLVLVLAGFVLFLRWYIRDANRWRSPRDEMGSLAAIVGGVLAVGMLVVAGSVVWWLITGGAS